VSGKKRDMTSFGAQRGDSHLHMCLPTDATEALLAISERFTAAGLSHDWQMVFNLMITTAAGKVGDELDELLVRMLAAIKAVSG